MRFDRTTSCSNQNLQKNQKCAPPPCLKSCLQKKSKKKACSSKSQQIVAPCSKIPRCQSPSCPKILIQGCTSSEMNCLYDSSPSLCNRNTCHSHSVKQRSFTSSCEEDNGSFSNQQNVIDRQFRLNFTILTSKPIN